MEALSSTTYSSSISKEKDQREENINEDAAVLKRRISVHPLYPLLVQTHLDSLKLVGGMGDHDHPEKNDKDMGKLQLLPLCSKPSLGVDPVPTPQSELDHFMEAYCLALGKLKEAMEEPQQKSMAFITNMHLQLQELTGSESGSHPAEPPTNI